MFHCYFPYLINDCIHYGNICFKILAPSYSVLFIYRLNMRTIGSTYRIMAIDPGVANLGVAILDYCPIGDKIVVVNAFTLVSDQLLKANPQLADILTARGAKLRLLYLALIDIMNKYEPDTLASEAPYLGRFPQSFAALVECIVHIRMAYYEYRPHSQITTIDPPTIKLAVGVGGKSGDKDEMTEGVRNYPGLDMDGIDLDDLDEHSVDAIAVGICKLRMSLGIAKIYEKKKKGRKKKKKRGK